MNKLSFWVCLGIICIISSTSRSQLLYFQAANQENMLNIAELSDDLHIKLIISTGEDLSDYDNILIRTYGTKRKNSNSKLIVTKYLSVGKLIDKHAIDGVYQLSFLQIVEDNVWASELGLENYGVKRYNFVRTTVHGVKKIGNQIVESHLITSDWLDVKNIKRSFYSNNRSNVGPALGLILTATFIAIPFLME